MRVLINLISLFQSGPKTVGFGFLEGLAILPREHQYILILPSGVGFEEFLENRQALFGNNFVSLFVGYPFCRVRSLKKLYLDHVMTACLARDYRVDVLFMTANFPCLFSFRPQLVLQHNQHYLIPRTPLGSFRADLRLQLERMLFWLGTRKCKNFLVQLETIKTQLATKFKLPSEGIHTVTMVPLPSFCHTYQAEKKSSGEDLKLFLPAKMHPNKNHRLLPRLAEEIKKRALPVHFCVTLSPEEYQNLLGGRTDLADRIVNIGQIPNQEMPAYYQKMDALFFPTSMESLGFPYIEALLCRLPILTSDLPFAREVCGEAALFYDLSNLDSIVSAIAQFVSNPSLLNEATARQREKYLHHWGDIMIEIVQHLSDLCTKDGQLND